MRILYYDCFAGISGDMNLGALIDLGVDKDYLVAELKKLNIEGFHLEVTQGQRKGITGTKADVIIENQENEKHRHLRHIKELVNASSLSDTVKTNALAIFHRIAEAEAKVHNISIEKVHFHEVGALDSIADIVGAAICLDALNVDKIISSSVQLGDGTVKCAHGIMPVPAPATAEILKGIPVRKGLVMHEATTPTGAAILAAMADEFSDDLHYPIKKTGYGLGNRDSDVANVLRVFLCETDDITAIKKARVIECNIDDMNPEHYDFLIETLFEAGASDVWLSPIQMKKSRPANTLSVLCPPEKSQLMKELIFRHSTSIGMREQEVSKFMLERRQRTIETKFGPVVLKESFLGNECVSAKPEYTDCKKLAARHNVSIAEIERAVIYKSMEE